MSSHLLYMLLPLLHLVHALIVLHLGHISRQIYRHIMQADGVHAPAHTSTASCMASTAKEITAQRNRYSLIDSGMLHA